MMSLFGPMGRDDSARIRNLYGHIPTVKWVNTHFEAEEKARIGNLLGEGSDLVDEVRIVGMQEFLNAFGSMMKEVLEVLELANGKWAFVTPPEKMGGVAKSNHWLVAQYAKFELPAPYGVLSYDMADAFAELVRDGVTHLVYVDDAWYSGLQLSDNIREMKRLCEGTGVKIIVGAPFSNPYALHPLAYNNYESHSLNDTRKLLVIRDYASEISWVSVAGVSVFVPSEGNFLPSLYDVAIEHGKEWKTVYEKFHMIPYDMIPEVSRPGGSKTPFSIDKLPSLSADTLASFEHACADHVSVPCAIYKNRIRGWCYRKRTRLLTMANYESLTPPLVEIIGSNNITYA